MARQIIVLDKSDANLGTIAVRVLFWITVAAGHLVPRSNFSSALDPTMFPATGIPGVQPVSTAEAAALTSGSVVEINKILEVPSDFTPAEIKAFLQRMYTNMVNEAAGQPKPLEWYGDSFDGSAWLA